MQHLQRYAYASALLVGLVLLSPPAVACDLTHSTYRAVGNPDFQLVFSEPPTALAGVVRATVTLQHPKRGKILSLHLNQSQGYGAFALFDPKKPDASYPLYFFNQKLEFGGASPSRTYTFVAGLGVSDYYSDRSGNQEAILGDVMWKLDSCRK